MNIESPVPGTGFSVVLIHISEVLFNTLTHSHLLCDNNFTYVLLVKASLAINSSLGPKISGFLLIFFSFYLLKPAQSEPVLMIYLLIFQQDSNVRIQIFFK